MEPRNEEVTEQTPEQTPDEEQLDFERGFNGEGDYEEPAQETDESEGEEPPEEEVLAEFGMTASQLREKLRQIDEITGIKQRLDSDLSKVYGKFGEINRHLQERGPGTLNKVALKRIREEYPDLAENLEQDLAEAIGSPGPNPASYQQEMDQRLQAATAQMTQRFEARLLGWKHPDFKALSTDPELDLWLAQAASEEAREKFRTSWDSAWISTQLDEFKEWRKKRSAQKPSSQRLEQAIAPTGAASRSPRPSATDEFLAGFKAARTQA